MCSHTRTPPPMSPSTTSTATTDSAPPHRDQHRLASRNSIFIGPSMAQAILLRCTSSDDEAEGRMEVCAAAEEEEGDQSRTDASEDSVEVRVLPIAPNPQSSLLQKNKRKLAEPRKVSSACKPISRQIHALARHRPSRGRHYPRLPRAALDDSPSSIKQHFPLSHIYHPREAHAAQPPMCPFRPWSSESLPERSTATPTTAYTPPPSTDGSSPPEPPAPAGLELRGESPPSTSDHPLPLFLNASGSSRRRQDEDIPEEEREAQGSRWAEDQPSTERAVVAGGSDCPALRTAVILGAEQALLRPKGEREEEVEANQLEAEEDDEECEAPMVLEAASTSSAVNAVSPSPASSQRSSGVNVASDGKDSGEPKNHLRNYKNMTRERRMEANARERTRVHTISAAFDTLRRAVPAYAHNQRLSKLSVLRIACAYIVTLSRVAGKDYSAAKDAPSLAECVDSVTRTIQTEGKVRRRRDE